jgi:hypothetical protein
MSYREFPITISGNPITHNLFNAQVLDSLSVPGSPKFIITENLLKITTESGLYLITEN